jgi:hypothetical protein
MTALPRRHLHAGALIFTTAALAAACGGSAQVKRGQARPPAQTSSATSCPNQASVARRPRLRRGGELRGDVDGDQRPDSVFLAVDPAGRGHCRFFLVARGDRAVYVAPLTPWGKAVDLEPSARLDRDILQRLKLNGLARITRSGGLSVLLDVWQGASTGFVQVFRVWRSRMRPMADGLFPYQGSVGHINGVDCAEGAGADSVVAGGASPVNYQRGDVYAVERLFYRVDGLRFRPLPKLTEHTRVRPGAASSFGAGFADEPFASCRTAAARRAT